MKKNLYLDLKQRHQQEVNALPLEFAFSDKQFIEMMKRFGLDETETDKIYKLGNTGGFYKRTDSKKIFDTFERHERERAEAIAADKTGNGYIYQMFLYELGNHEYCFTYSLTDTLNEVGLTLEEINNDPRLLHGLQKAKKDYLEKC